MTENRFVELAMAIWAAGRRRLAGELFSVSFYRSLVLRPPHTQPPRADLSRLISTNSQNGDALARGSFFLAGITEYFSDTREPWTKPAPSRRFAAYLHDFGWIHDLLASNNPEALALARAHMDHWVQLYGQWNPFSWAPGLTAKRCLNWLSAGHALLGDTEGGSQRRACLLTQIYYLNTFGGIAAHPRDRLQIALVLAAVGALVPGAERFLERGLALLKTQLQEQILPDGGHVSRSPEAAAATLCDLISLKKLLEDQVLKVPDELERALVRLAPMVRFLCAVDGHLAAFNGGGEGLFLAVEHLLHGLKVPKKTFTYAPYSGYQRVETPASVLIMDTGRAPPGRFSQHAHAGALGLEISTPGGRLIVNCGWSEDQSEQWHLPARTSAAHSTLIINNTSSAQISSGGLRHAFLGSQLRQRGPSSPARSQHEPDEGTKLEASHNGYLHRHGLIHQRKVFINETGTKITGEDQVFRPVVSPKVFISSELGCVVRFHLHPHVRASLARDDRQALLVLPGGEGWRFFCSSGKLELQPSVYLAAGAPPQRTVQLLLHHRLNPKAAIHDNQNRIAWSLERVSHER